MGRNETQDAKPLLNIQFNHAAWKEARPKKMSRRQLARELGTTDSNLFSIENGKSKPSIELAFRYCLFVHLPVEDLCLEK